MSGFEVYNSAGKLLVDSQNRSTLFYDQRALGAVTDKGTYRVNSPLVMAVRSALLSSHSGMTAV